MPLNIGVDLGGTKVKTALVDERGRIIKEMTQSIEQNRTFTEVLKCIIGSIERCLPVNEKDRREVRSIGIGAAGQIDLKKGIILFSPNLNWQNAPICEEIGKVFPYPLIIENDVRAAALGEQAFGAGKGVKDLICIFVGTGVGSGIIINNKLLRGTSNMAGEIGHIKVAVNGYPCSCGGKGCLEAYAGGGHVKRRVIKAVREGIETSIEKLVGGKLEDINISVVEKALKSGDNYAREIWDEITQALGIGMANLVTIFNPKRLVLGGGVVEASPSLVHTVRHWIDKKVTMLSREEVEVAQAQLGGDAGVIGATLLISHLDEREL